MKVIITQKDTKLGLMGKILTVSDGYARNYLLPKGIVKVATDEVILDHEKMKKETQEKENSEIEKYAIIAQKLTGVRITIAEKAEGKKTFGSINEKRIAKEILEQEKISIDASMIEPLKKLGKHTVKIVLDPKHTSEIIVEIVKVL